MLDSVGSSTKLVSSELLHFYILCINRGDNAEVPADEDRDDIRNISVNACASAQPPADKKKDKRGKQRKAAIDNEGGRSTRASNKH